MTAPSHQPVSACRPRVPALVHALLSCSMLAGACTSEGGVKLESRTEILHFEQSSPLSVEPEETIVVLPATHLPQDTQIDDCVIAALQKHDSRLNVVPATEMPNTFSFDGTLGLYDVNALLDRPEAKPEIARAKLRHIVAVESNWESGHVLQCVTIACEIQETIRARVWDTSKHSWVAEMTVVSNGRGWAPTLLLFLPFHAASDVSSAACAEVARTLGDRFSGQAERASN